MRNYIYLFMLVYYCIFNPTHGTANSASHIKFEGEIVYDKAYGGFHIFKINGSATDKEIQLTQKDSRYSENNVEPKWSPDGKYVAYINRGSSEKSNIFIMDSDGQNKRKITTLNYGIIFNIRWSKAGNEILFTYNPNKPGENIIEKAVNIETGVIRNVNIAEEKLKECSETMPSPDGEVLICRKWLMSGKDSLAIFQKESKPATMTEKIMMKIRKLFRKEQEMIFYKAKLFKKKKELILEDASSPLWSGDSSRFAFLIKDNLVIFDKNGNEMLRGKDLCKHEGAACLRKWPDNSKKVLYSCYCGAEGIQEKIYLLDLENSKSLYIADGQNPDWYFNAR